jgi:glycosyltransferase involved in cell wall biosynthesis
MKICFIGSGEIEIPPKGWGALETVIWNQSKCLKEIGIDVFIVNENSPEKTLNKISQINPDIVHLHYGKNYEIMPHLKCRKIVTNHDGSFVNSLKFHEHLVRNFFYDCEFFILTSWEKKFLQNLGISPKKVKIISNGVTFDSFKFNEAPNFPSKSICLGKIDSRKNQAFIQSLNCNVDFAGENHCKIFNTSKLDYLGSWNRDDVYNKLTNYCNFVLLSESELQPLVCLEALSAGLGLVISEAASQNLDCSLPFITVIPQHLIRHTETVSLAISNNRNICNNIAREKIREYAKSFDWKNICKKYQKYIS